MSGSPAITPDVANILGNYVYLYVDPRNEEVFYVGKGVGDRATCHLDAQGGSRKVQRISAIRASGCEPRIDIIAHGLRDEEEAFKIEAALIELLGTKTLTNEIRGWQSNERTCKPLTDFIMECARHPVEVTDPSVLIRINKLFKYGMSPEHLYEATRGVWVIGQRRTRAKYAMTIYAGIIREVYEIASWHRAGTTEYNTRDACALRQKERRWEFQGHLAAPPIRDKYFGGSVEHYFRAGQQSPVVGVNL